VIEDPTKIVVFTYTWYAGTAYAFYVSLSRKVYLKAYEKEKSRFIREYFMPVARVICICVSMFMLLGTAFWFHRIWEVFLK
jgi:hypothetical protein